MNGERLYTCSIKMVYTAFRLGLVAILLASDAFAQSDSSVDDTSEQKTARGMKITTGITWDSPQEDDSEVLAA